LIKENNKEGNSVILFRTVVEEQCVSVTTPMNEHGKRVVGNTSARLNFVRAEADLSTSLADIYDACLIPATLTKDMRAYFSCESKKKVREKRKSIFMLRYVSSRQGCLVFSTFMA